MSDLDAFRSLVDMWSEVAADLRDEDDDFARGQASGLRLAARQLEAEIDRAAGQRVSGDPR